LVEDICRNVAEKSTLRGMLVSRQISILSNLKRGEGCEPMAACTRFRSSWLPAKATSISCACGTGVGAARAGAGAAGVWTGTMGADGLLLRAVKAMACCKTCKGDLVLLAERACKRVESRLLEN
jgi:hypothetical protein